MESGLLDEPIVRAEPADGQAERRARRRTGFGRRLRRWFLWLVALALVLALLPVALAFLYLSPSVHPISTLMARDLATGAGYDRRWAPLEDISQHLVHSVIMSEDGQFCSHRGVDWVALNAVIDDALSGEPTRGASTIPMQTVKNLFLWHGRSFVRKALEVPMAIGYDAVTPKRRIIETYLNIAEWAPGVYGAEAAAQHHFGKPAKALTRRQAALLAVTLPNPAARNPARPTPGLSRLAALIERRTSQAGSHVGCVRP